MPIRFLNPNFHVILIHYPLGVFVLGVLLELFSFLWRNSSVRVAARWMILLGGLASLVSVTSGIYALSDVATHQEMTSERAYMLRRHVWLVGCGSLIAVLVAVWGLAASDAWRRRLYVPLLAGLVAAWGLMTVGSWFGGETIYTQGTSVAYKPHQVRNVAREQHEPATAPTHPIKQHHFVPYYTGEPVQIHMIVAGLTFAVAFGALGLSIRRITSQYPDEPATVMAGIDTGSGPLPPADLEMVRSFNPIVEPPPPAVTDPGAGLPAARFWILAALAAILTALAGYWVWAADNNMWAWGDFWQDIMASRNKLVFTRASVHVWVGVLLIVLSFVLAGLTRFAQNLRSALAIVATLLVLAVAAQIWLGVLLRFDGMEGPLYRFSPETSKPESTETAMAGPYAGSSFSTSIVYTDLTTPSSARTST